MRQLDEFLCWCPDYSRVLDADIDPNVLRERVNAYMATPEMVNYNRRKYQIREDSMRSDVYEDNGGGCLYRAWITIEKVVPLVVHLVVPAKVEGKIERRDVGGPPKGRHVFPQETGGKKKEEKGGGE